MDQHARKFGLRIFPTDKTVLFDHIRRNTTACVQHIRIGGWVVVVNSVSFVTDAKH